MSFQSDFITTALRRLKYYKELGEKAMAQLEEQELHWQPGPESNSVAVIVQHLSGNMLSRWTNVLTEDGEKPWRQRDAEFEEQKQSREEILQAWNRGWTCFLDALASFTEDDLVKTITIRGEELTVTDAVNRQLAHYPYHIGQIVYLARMIRGAKWTNLSIPKGESDKYNQGNGTKDPSKKY